MAHRCAIFLAREDEVSSSDCSLSLSHRVRPQSFHTRFLWTVRSGIYWGCRVFTVLPLLLLLCCLALSVGLLRERFLSLSLQTVTKKEERVRVCRQRTRYANPSQNAACAPGPVELLSVRR